MKYKYPNRVINMFMFIINILCAIATLALLVWAGTQREYLSAAVCVPLLYLCVIGQMGDVRLRNLLEQVKSVEQAIKNREKAI